MKCFMMTVGSKYYLLASDKRNITDNIARQFIDKICEVNEMMTNKSWRDTRERASKDRCTLDDFKRRIDHCEYEEIITEKVHYHKVFGSNFMCSIPDNEKGCLIFF